jgi:hypothetical protein
MAEKGKHAGGRPSKYKPEFVHQAYEIGKLGATDEQIASIFQVAIATISNWKTDYPEFLEALKRGKRHADEAVIKSLYERANGYTCKETKVLVVKGEVVQVEIEKHHPPDVTACIFWLKNRDQANWRDRTEVTGEGGAPVGLIIKRYTEPAGEIDGPRNTDK